MSAGADDLYLIHPERKLYRKERRADLLAPNTPTQSTGRFIVFQDRIPTNQALLVKAVVPYAQARTNPGTDTESFETILPNAGNGFFGFEVLVNDSSPNIFDISLNTPRSLTGGTTAGLNNQDRQGLPGLSTISGDVEGDLAQQWQNPLFGFVVPGGATLRIIFSILPPATDNPFPVLGRYTIGVNAVKRVDFAGVVVAGHQMPSQVLSDISRALRPR